MTWLDRSNTNDGSDVILNDVRSAPGVLWDQIFDNFLTIRHLRLVTLDVTLRNPTKHHLRLLTLDFNKKRHLRLVTLDVTLRHTTLDPYTSFVDRRLTVTLTVALDLRGVWLESGVARVSWWRVKHEKSLSAMLQKKSCEHVNCQIYSSNLVNWNEYE